MCVNRLLAALGLSKRLKIEGELPIVRQMTDLENHRINKDLFSSRCCATYRMDDESLTPNVTREVLGLSLIHI